MTVEAAAKHVGITWADVSSVVKWIEDCYPVRVVMWSSRLWVEERDGALQWSVMVTDAHGNRILEVPSCSCAFPHPGFRSVPALLMDRLYWLLEHVETWWSAGGRVAVSAATGAALTGQDEQCALEARCQGPHPLTTADERAKIRLRRQRNSDRGRRPSTA